MPVVVAVLEAVVLKELRNSSSPHLNQTSTESAPPMSVRFPFKVAEVDSTLVAALVVTIGVVISGSSVPGATQRT